jgi:hypothetical protein
VGLLAAHWHSDFFAAVDELAHRSREKALLLRIDPRLLRLIHQPSFWVAELGYSSVNSVDNSVDKDLVY